VWRLLVDAVRRSVLVVRSVTARAMRVMHPAVLAPEPPEVRTTVVVDSLWREEQVVVVVQVRSFPDLGGE